MHWKDLKKFEYQTPLFGKKISYYIFYCGSNNIFLIRQNSMKYSLISRIYFITGPSKIWTRATFYHFIFWLDMSSLFCWFVCMSWWNLQKSCNKIEKCIMIVKKKLLIKCLYGERKKILLLSHLHVKSEWMFVQKVKQSIAWPEVLLS